MTGNGRQERRWTIGELAQACAALRAQIGELLREIGNPAGPDPQRIMTTSEMMSVFDTYFTEQQRDMGGEPGRDQRPHGLVRRSDR